MHARMRNAVTASLWDEPEYAPPSASATEANGAGAGGAGGCEEGEQEEEPIITVDSCLRRINHVVSLPVPRLFALYGLSDVMLDSYMAGGCTSTRHALELGAPVVTLPAAYLGGRWTKALYDIMGVTDLVASSKEDFVELAVKVATSETSGRRRRRRQSGGAGAGAGADGSSNDGNKASFRELVVEKIRRNFGKLLHSVEAVTEWEKMLIRLDKIGGVVQKPRQDSDYTWHSGLSRNSKSKKKKKMRSPKTKKEP